MVEASKYVAKWRREIASVAREHMGDEAPSQDALGVELVFRFPRPKSHGPGAPLFRTQRPDVDKLARAVLDACTGIVYMDDCQVVALGAQKQYGDAAGVEIIIESM